MDTRSVIYRAPTREDAERAYHEGARDAAAEGFVPTSEVWSTALGQQVLTVLFVHAPDQANAVLEALGAVEAVPVSLRAAHRTFEYFPPSAVLPRATRPTQEHPSEHHGWRWPSQAMVAVTLLAPVAWFVVFTNDKRLANICYEATHDGYCFANNQTTQWLFVLIIVGWIVAMVVLTVFWFAQKPSSQ